MTLTKKQQQALKRLWRIQESESNYEGESYLSFRRRVEPGFGGEYVMIQSRGMWIGVELDGYAHT